MYILLRVSSVFEQAIETYLIKHKGYKTINKQELHNRL